MENNRDIQDIFFDNLQYIKDSNLPKHVIHTAEDIANCRTNAMHGHVYQCPKKHFTAILRNSCNNRNCPKCQNHHKFKWMKDTKKMALNTPHYHLVLKLPSFCNPYFLKNYRQFVNILFVAGKKTVEKIIRYSDYNNSLPGIIMALHTYGEHNELHPHLHIIMTAGGIDTKGKWVEYDTTLFHSKSFPSFYTSIIRKELGRYAKDHADLQNDFILNTKNIHTMDIFVSEKYSTPDHIINYLANTIRGTSIQNKHILNASSGIVKYKTKSNDKSELSEQEFIRRYLIHVLPWNQKSIRYAGLYSSSSRKRLGIAKSLFPESDCKPEIIEDETLTENESEFINPYKICPVCKKKMLQIEKVLPYKVPLFIIAKFGKDPPIEELFIKRAA